MHLILGFKISRESACFSLLLDLDGLTKPGTAAEEKMGALSIEQALHQASLEDKPDGKAEDALEAFVRLLLQKLPSLRSKIVKMVETQAWNEVPPEEIRQADLLSSLKAIDAHECDMRGGAETDTRSTPTGKNVYNAARATEGPTSMAMGDGLCTNVTQPNKIRLATRDKRSMRSTMPAREAATEAESESESEAATEAESESVSELESETEPETEPETEQEERSVLLEADAGSGPAPTRDLNTVAELTVRGARASTQTTNPECDPGDAIVAARTDAGDTTDPENESEHGDTFTHVRTSEKRLSPECAVARPEKKFCPGGTGLDMAAKYADLCHLSLLFARALSAKRSQSEQIEALPSDFASFREIYDAVVCLGSQRDLCKVRSTYFSACLARRWVEAAESYAAERENDDAARDIDESGTTPRQFLLPKKQAYRLTGVLSDADLRAFRQSMKRWRLFELVRRFFEQDLGEQSIIAIFAFYDPICERPVSDPSRPGLI